MARPTPPNMFEQIYRAIEPLEPREVFALVRWVFTHPHRVRLFLRDAVRGVPGRTAFDNASTARKK